MLSTIQFVLARRSTTTLHHTSQSVSHKYELRNVTSLAGLRAISGDSVLSE